MKIFRFSRLLPLTVALCGLMSPAQVHAARLVVLTTTAWDFVKELGLEKDVVGRAENVEAPELASAPSVGRSDGVNLELLLAQRPEIVLGSPQYHGALAEALQKAGSKLELIRIRQWSDVPAELTRLAAALGAGGDPAARATALSAAMQQAAAPARDAAAAPLKVLVIVSADPLLVATAGSYSADLIKLAGGNGALVADQAGSQFRGFAALSEEKFLELDPDFILLSRWRGVDQLEAVLGKKPFWNQLRAVRKGALKQVEAAQLYTVPGPRGLATVKTLRAEFEKALTK